MKTLTLATILIILLSVSAIPSEQEKGPKIEFENTVFDFGEVTEGKHVNCSFKFHNTGDQPLLIKMVKSSCGCLAPSWSKEPVMPGDSNYIRAVFNSGNRGGGMVQKSLMVITNSGQENEQQILLIVTGKVLKKD